jgi:hypothetical protein
MSFHSTNASANLVEIAHRSRVPAPIVEMGLARHFEQPLSPAVIPVPVIASAAENVHPHLQFAVFFLV